MLVEAETSIVSRLSTLFFHRETQVFSSKRRLTPFLASLLPLLLEKIFYDLTPLNIHLDDLAIRALALPDPITLGGPRIVIHLQTSEDAVNDLLALISVMKEEQIAKGWVPIPVEESTTSSRIRDASTPLYKFRTKN